MFFPCSTDLSLDAENIEDTAAGVPSPSGLTQAAADEAGPARPSAVTFNEATFVGGDEEEDDAPAPDDLGPPVLAESASELTFKQNANIALPHLLVHWKDQYVQERCTLFVWQLSGLQPHDVSARVVRGGEALEVKFAWPSPLQDANSLTQGKFSRDSSKVVEIDDLIKKMKMGS